MKEGGERVHQRPTTEAEFGVATVYDFKHEWDGSGNRASAERVRLEGVPGAAFMFDKSQSIGPWQRTKEKPATANNEKASHETSIVSKWRGLRGLVV